MGFSTKRAATLAAAEALQLLPGTGWSIHVWQNHSWHACLQNLGLSVYIHAGSLSADLRYSALLSRNLTHVGTGEVFWSTNGKLFRQPLNAVKYQLKIAKDFLFEAAGMAEAISNNLNTAPEDAAVWPARAKVAKAAPRKQGPSRAHRP